MPWINERFGIEAYSAKRLGYRDASDTEIFFAAREANAIVITKDKDFLNLLAQYDPPSQVLWVTLGNSSNASITEVFTKMLPQAIALYEGGEVLVEVEGLEKI